MVRFLPNPSGCSEGRDARELQVFFESAVEMGPALRVGVGCDGDADGVKGLDE